MTREEALEIFEHNWTCLKNYAYTDNELDEALEMAIQALEQEPCEDTISRQAAIDAMSNALERVFPEHRAIAERTMNKLPPVTPQPDSRLEKIADIVEGTIDHFDRDDALDMLYQIKEVIK